MARVVITEEDVCTECGENLGARIEGTCYVCDGNLYCDEDCARVHLTMKLGARNARLVMEASGEEFEI